MFTPEQRLLVYRKALAGYNTGEIFTRHGLCFALNKCMKLLVNEKILDIDLLEDAYIEECKCYPEIYLQKPEEPYSASHWFEQGLAAPHIAILKNAITEVKKLINSPG